MSELTTILLVVLAATILWRARPADTIWRDDERM